MNIGNNRTFKLQAGEYLLEHIDSVNTAAVFECARGLLALVAVRATPATWNPELGSLASGSASSWGPAAVAALCELWDCQPQGLGHAQIMAVLAPCLKHLAVLSKSRSQCVTSIWRSRLDTAICYMPHMLQSAC